MTIGAGQNDAEQQASFSTLCVLIVVDTVGALASGGLKNNCYMVDNNHYLGSWREGSEELHTVCQDGQAIVWDVASVSPDTPIAIAGFSGRMVEEGTCAPKRLPDGSWEGRVESRGVFAAFPYAVTLSINQKTEMKATCFIKVV